MLVDEEDISELEQSKEGIELVEVIAGQFRKKNVERQESLMITNPDLFNKITEVEKLKVQVDKEKLLEYQQLILELAQVDGEMEHEELISKINDLTIDDKVFADMVSKQNNIFDHTTEQEKVLLTSAANDTINLVNLINQDYLIGSLEVSEEFGYFIFLTFDIVSTQIPDLIQQWCSQAHEKYPESGLLNYLFGYVSALIPSTTKTDIDFQRIFFESLQTDPIIIIRGFEKLTSLLHKQYEDHPNVLKLAHSTSGKAYFPKIDEPGSFLNAVISFRYATLAEYYRVIDNSLKYEELINQSLVLWNENPYAILLKAYSKIQVDSLEAEKLFEEALDLVPIQFGEKLKQYIPSIQANGYSGIGFVYRERKIYELAESFFTRAIFYSSSEFSLSITSLNRGQNRIDNDDPLGALNDLQIAKNDPNFSALAHTNIGKIYFSQGLYDKAESELIFAIEQGPHLAPAYYNLGMLYIEEGKKIKQGVFSKLL